MFARSLQVLRLPRLVVANGSLEALKYLAVLLMVGDHIGKYLFNGTIELLFNAGRVAMPLFVFVLAYNLARPGAFDSGVYGRTMRRLALFGILSTPPFVTLGGLWHGFWPLNILFTLLGIAAMLYLIEQGTAASLVSAAAVFIVGGSSVEFWWPAFLIGAGVWGYRKQPNLSFVALVLAGLLALWFINSNLWALCAVPIAVAAACLDLRVRRARWFFYAFYPLHLVALLLIRVPMRKAGYLFF